LTALVEKKKHLLDFIAGRVNLRTVLKRFGLCLDGSFENEPAGIGDPDLPVRHFNAGRGVWGRIRWGRSFLGSQDNARRDQQRRAGAKYFD
jgi:hypothetical protein